MSEVVYLPEEVAKIAESVSVEKRTEVQTVLNHVFNGVSKMRAQLDSVAVADENDKVNMKLANTIRLGVRQVRLDAEKTFDAKRSEVQQQMLSFKTEDALWLKAKQTMQILTKEIEETARWKEETRERFEAEQRELKTQTRALAVQKFVPDMPLAEFANMSDESFTLFLNGIETAYNAKKEAEAKAEAERLAAIKAEEEAREKQRLENERLRAEAAKREQEIAKEREAAMIEREKIEAAAREELRKANEVAAKLQAEIEAKQKAEAAAKAKADAEAEAAKKAAEKAAKAPMQKQLTNWIDSFELPPFSTETVEAKVIHAKFEAFKEWARTQVISK